MKKIKSIDQFNKKIKVPYSKSEFNRALILASLREDECRIYGVPTSTDSQTLIKCLQIMGKSISCDTEKVVLKNKLIDKSYDLNVMDGGTTSRFITVLCSKFDSIQNISASKRMNERPMSELYEVLEKYGVKIWKEGQSFPIKIKGKAKFSGSVEVSSRRSTQFLSALKLVYPEVNFYSKDVQSSQKYIDLTNFVIENFSNNYFITGDFSSASYSMMLAAILGEVYIENIKSLDKLQADSVFFDILDKCGSICYFENGMVVKKKDLKPFEHDCSSCLDLVPTLVVLASKIEGRTVLKNLKNLKYKESNRFDEIIKSLIIFNVTHEVEGENLVIIGSKSKASYKKIDCVSDHRVVMMNALFLLVNSGGELIEFDSIKKSYENFFKDLCE